MHSLLWFRAFSRATIRDIVEVLRVGDTPHPDPGSATRRHEVTLGIPEPCVYAYLGMTLEEFGRSAIALGLDAFDGDVSPFDSGGLVNKIRPVCSWPDADRQAFLMQYTWSHTQLPQLLALYPGGTAPEIASYLDGAQPNLDGFHALFPGLPAAALWRENADRRAWVWEGRRPRVLPIGGGLVAWSCPPDQFEELLDLARDATADRLWLVALIRKYVRGGVTALLRELRSRQEAA